MRGTMKYWAGAFVTVMLLALCLLIPSGKAYADETSGSWTYTVSNGNATITGYTGTGTTLSVPSSIGGYPVTAIKYGAFKDNNTITSAAIPSSVTKIGSNGSSYAGAFENCTRLATVTFTAGSEDAMIGANSFKGCTALKSLTIPANYKDIYYAAFSGDTALTSLNWKGGAYSYAYQTIASTAFNGCTALTTITLADVSSIGPYVFENAERLSSLTLNEGLIKIEHGAFKGCVALQTVTIPSTVTTIGNSGSSYAGAFEGCTRLATLNLTAGSEDAMIGANSFKGCTSLKSLTIPANYRNIYYEAFRGDTALTSLNWKGGAYSYAYQTMASSAFNGCTALTTVTLADVKEIGPYAFENDEKLNSLTLNEGITKIDHGAFKGCTVLQTVTIPSTVTTIGNSGSSYAGAFEGCTRLATVNLTAGTEDAMIGANSFKGCTALKSITVPANYRNIYYEAFSGDTALTSLNWKGGAYSYAYQTIASTAFNGCTALTTVTLADVKEIGPYAFENDEKLNSLTLNEGITKIDHGAFKGCTVLQTVTIPSTVTTIGNSGSSYAGAFEGCTKLATVTLKAGTEDAMIGANSFKGCTALKSITVPANYRNIYYEAFRGDTALTSLNWKGGAYDYAYQTMASSAFNGCTALTTVTLADVVSIAPYAFENDEKLNSLTLNEGLTKIEHGAFKGCTVLQTVTIPSTVTTIGNSGSSYAGAFEGCTKLATVTLKAGSSDAMIGANTFSGCASLKKIVIPDNYTNIYYKAFNGCAALDLIVFVGTGPSIADTAFTGVTAVVYYPSANASTYAVGSNYGGSLTWLLKPAKPATASIANVATGLKLTWGKVESIDGYKVYRKKATASSYTLIKTLTGTTYTDTTCEDGVIYNYRVCGYVTGSGNILGTYSAVKTGAHLKAPTISQTTNTAGGLKLTWTKVAGAAGYRILRKAPGETAFTAYATTTTTGVTWTDTGVTAGNAYAYQVRAYVKSADGNSTYFGLKSAAKSATYRKPPVISTQPSNVTAKEGETAKFTVKATGTGLSYQWQYRTSASGTWAKTGATGNQTATLSVPVTTGRNGYQYRCSVANSGGTVYTKAVTLTVTSGDKPVIKTQPSSVTIDEGSTAVFAIAATGDGLTYQWQYRTSASGTWAKATASGNQTATLMVPATAGRNGYQYRCIVTNSAGSVYSNAATLKLKADAPVIKTQPSSVTVDEGSTAVFAVAATGDGLTYQWQYRTSASGTWARATANGNTSATLFVSATGGRNGYQYRCAVTNNGGTVYSKAATLTVSVTTNAESETETETETEIQTEDETQTETEIQTETELQTETEESVLLGSDETEAAVVTETEAAETEDVEEE